jgi:outer membrane biogenesis lipoprotein LolB
MKRMLAALVALLLCGCVAVPFQAPARISMEQTDPRELVERFQASVPDSFQLLSTVVFEYNWRTFSGIGSVFINRSDRVFRVAAMNPLGVKLFELSGDQNAVTNHYTIAAFSRYSELTTAVGADIKRIYFDLVPSADARFLRKKYSVSFRQPLGDGVIEYVFAGAAGNLVEKNYYAEDGIAWRASYYEYREQNGKRWPRGIIFINYHYGYRLTVRQKELGFEDN